MRTAHEDALDLNLLRVLDVLLEERGVTRAAARLGMTQSAVSHALSRLRAQLGDPLLVRTPQGMIPTSRAERIAAPLRAALDGVGRALDDEQGFDPKTARRSFTLASADYAGFVLLPRLMKRFEAEAPGVDLYVLPPSDRPLERLESGEIDLSINLKRHAKGGVRCQQILRDRFAVVVRRDHPAVGRKMTLDQYVELSHVLVAPNGRGRPRGFVDDALAELGRARRVALVLPHFLVAPSVIAETDMVLTIARRVAARFEDSLELKVLEPPVELEGFELYQMWHERMHHDRAHAWLRQTIAEVAKESA